MKIARVAITEEFGPVGRIIDIQSEKIGVRAGAIAEVELPVELESEQVKYLQASIDSEGVITFSVNQALKDADLAQAPIIASEAAVGSAMVFGNQIVKEFAAENLRLGITQAGQTKTVRQKAAEVVSALTTGSLYDALDELKLIPALDYDATFITEARILFYGNKIRAYVGLAAVADVADLI